MATNTPHPSPLIDVDKLTVGMFVHLGLGWMSHPFPLSNFRITTPGQIATIRGLGVKQVRWNPAHSEASGEGGESAALLSLTETRVNAPAAPAAATAAPASPQAVAQRELRESLSAQRVALSLCERQFAEAASECKQLTHLVATQPVAAGEQAKALSRALVSKMMGAQDLCIRLLVDASGDRASAHALNVSVLALLMGHTLGWLDEDMLDLGVGSLLHDVGNLELPDWVRHRNEHFSAAEQKFYESHVAQGVALGKKMGISPGALLLIEQHHEFADGTGFPMRIGSDRTTAAARVVALINLYDNLCNPAIPAQAVTPHEALSQIFAQLKNKFDTAILSAFIKMMGVYPAGSVVQLTDDRFAMVVSVNASRSIRPRVLVHNPKVPRDEALILDLAQHGGLGIRRSIKPMALPSEALAYLSPRQRVAYYFEPGRDVAQSMELA